MPKWAARFPSCLKPRLRLPRTCKPDPRKRRFTVCPEHEHHTTLDSRAWNFPAGRRPVLDRHLGRVRGHHSAAARHQEIPTDADVLSRHLDFMEVSVASGEEPDARRDGAGVLRADLAPGAGGDLGGRTGFQLWADAVRRGVRGVDEQRAERFQYGHVFERNDLLYFGAWRRFAALWIGTRPGGHGSGIWVWISGGGYRLFAVYLRLLCGARGKYFAPRFAGRNAAYGWRAATAPQLCAGTGSAGGIAERMGALVRGADGESSFVSGAGLFSFAT